MKKEYISRLMELLKERSYNLHYFYKASEYMITTDNVEYFIDNKKNELKITIIMDYNYGDKTLLKRDYYTLDKNLQVEYLSIRNKKDIYKFINNIPVERI